MTVTLNSHMPARKEQAPECGYEPERSSRQLWGHVYIQGTLTLLLIRLRPNSGFPLVMVTENSLQLWKEVKEGTESMSLRGHHLRKQQGGDQMIFLP